MNKRSTNNISNLRHVYILVQVDIDEVEHNKNVDIVGVFDSKNKAEKTKKEMMKLSDREYGNTYYFHVSKRRVT